MEWEKINDNHYENDRFSICKPEGSEWWYVSWYGKPNEITQDIMDILHWAYDSAEEAMNLIEEKARFN